MRFCVLAVGLCACQFSGDPSVIDAGPTDDGSVIDAPPATTLCRSADPAVVACFDFEGDFTDGSLNGHEGQAVGNPQFVPAQLGLGLDFDGDDSVFIPDSDDFDVSALTMEVWFTANALPPSDTERLFWDTQAQYAVMLFGDSGQVRCGAAGDGQGTFDSPVAVGVPHYIACTITATDLRVYVDGEEVGSQGRAAPLVTAPTSGSAIAADINNGGVPSNQFNGVIDTVRISSVARSAEQICIAAGINPATCQSN